MADAISDGMCTELESDSNPLMPDKTKLEFLTENGNNVEEEKMVRELHKEAEQGKFTSIT